MHTLPMIRRHTVGGAVVHTVPAPPTSAQIHAALRADLARRLGWTGRTAAHLLGRLTEAQLARCLAEDPAAVRAALWECSAAFLAKAA